MIRSIYENAFGTLLYVLQITPKKACVSKVNIKDATHCGWVCTDLQYICDNWTKSKDELFQLYLDQIKLSDVIRREYDNQCELVFDIQNNGICVEKNKIISIDKILNVDDLICEHGHITKYGLELEAVRINKHVIDCSLNVSFDKTFVSKQIHKLTCVEDKINACHSIKKQTKQKGNCFEHKIILTIGNKSWTVYSLYTEQSNLIEKPNTHYIITRKEFRNANKNIH